jgi:glycine dehydrogenase
MISIKSEINMVGKKYSIEDNPLVNAPHTAEEMVEDKWKHCYSKEVAFYPDNRKDDKYWPPVKRIDNVYGDRNLFCSCPQLKTIRI